MTLLFHGGYLLPKIRLSGFPQTHGAWELIVLRQKVRRPQKAAENYRSDSAN